MKTQQQILKKPHSLGESWQNYKFKKVFMADKYNKYVCLIIAYLKCKYGTFYGLCFSLYEIEYFIKRNGEPEFMVVEIFNFPAKTWNSTLKYKTEEELLSILNSSGYPKKQFVAWGGNDIWKNDIQNMLKREYDKNIKRPTNKYEYKKGKIKKV